MGRRMGLGGVLGTAAATAAGAYIGKRVATEVEPRIPENIPPGISGSELWRRIKWAQGTNVMRGLMTGVFLWILWGFIKNNVVQWTNPLEAQLIFWVPAFIIWMVFRSCERTRLIAAIKAYVEKGILDQRVIELTHMQSVPRPAQEMIESYSKKVEEVTAKVENQHFDDAYFPDLKNLRFEELEWVHRLFTERHTQNMKNFIFWLMVKPEEKQQEVLGEVREEADRMKVRMFDMKKKPRRKSDWEYYS